MLTDTPPEKVARQILPWSFNFKPNEGSSGSSLFSGIMDKFAKVDDKEKPPERLINLPLIYIFLVLVDLLIQKDWPNKEQLLNILKRTMLSAPMGWLNMEVSSLSKATIIW
ncbi:hypothetical protein GH714_024354 [Hevea brasiliensis]|uniref:Uncharacterized protein n=1 Tax=Hevea brasiliensis TaxID=3981 RepID=A0A6A6LSA8_HEVBR|nr:hypothetical protein GH714_024354 [Hevea brasiliensis]